MRLGNIFFGLAAAVPSSFSLGTAAVATGTNDDTYIVVFERGIETPGSVVHEVQETLKSLGATINWEYHTVIRGFSVTGSKSIMEKLKLSNNKEYPFVIEKDQEVTTP